MSERFDAIIIGTGQAGPSLAGRLTAAGWRVAVVERERFGGTCVNYGCTPTKALVASAKAAHTARRAGDFGIEVEGPVRVDMKKVKARKDEIAGRSNRGVEGWMKGLEGAVVYQDHAAFVGDKQLRVGDQTIEADKIFINVGARAAIPPIEGLDGVPYLTNASLLDLETLPEHLIVVGGGYVGVEFAQVYRRFGARVTVIDRGPCLMSGEDDDVTEAIHAIFADEGIDVLTDARVEAVCRDGQGVRVELTPRGDPHSVRGSHLLLATGRRPNTDDLGLDKTGIATDDKGFVPVDERLGTAIDGIFALGDCNGRGAFTHTSYNDFEIVAANLLEGDDRKVSDRIPCYTAFTDPPFARVGASERELRTAGRKALITRLPMARVARAREMSETQGFMKIMVDAHTRRILGAAMVGTRCDEVIHALGYLMYAGAPYTVIERAVPIHPTVAELLPSMFKQLEPLA